MSQQPLPVRSYDAGSSRPAGRYEGAERPALRVVSQPRRKPARVPFVVLCSVLMTLGLVALLALNLSLMSGSYLLHDVTAQAEGLRAQEAELTEKVALESTPATLAKGAEELGLVPGGIPAYLRLPSGEVVGEARPAPSPSVSLDSAAEENVASGAAGRKGDPAPEEAPSSAEATGKPTAAGAPQAAN